LPLSLVTRKLALLHSTRANLLDSDIASQNNALQLLSNAGIIAQLEELVSDRTGVPVRHLRAEPIVKSRRGDPRSRPADRRLTKLQRSYTRHWFEPKHAKSGPPMGHSRGHVAVFVKAATSQDINSDLERFLNERSGQGFRVPFFYGAFDHSGLNVAAWEMVEGPIRGFNEHSSEEKRRIVGAIAAINRLPRARIVGRRREVSWLYQPKRYSIRRLFAGRGERRSIKWEAEYRETLKRMSGFKAVCGRLERLGQHCFSHNDLPGSFIVPDEGDVIFFDWELATLNVAGADLAFTVGTRADDAVVSHYLAEMAHHGLTLNEADVRFAMEALRAFHLLRKGWKRRSSQQVNRALGLLEPYNEGRVTMRIPCPPGVI
jgi:hypothetical protein